MEITFRGRDKEIYDLHKKINTYFAGCPDFLDDRIVITDVIKDFGYGFSKFKAFIPYKYILKGEENV